MFTYGFPDTMAQAWKPNNLTLMKQTEDFGGLSINTAGCKIQLKGISEWINPSFLRLLFCLQLICQTGCEVMALTLIQAEDKKYDRLKKPKTRYPLYNH